MKSLGATIIFFSFIGIAVFGFVAMTATHGEDGELCLANVAKSFGCLTETNTFSLSIWHVSVFKNFSMATLLIAGLAFLIALASLLAGGIKTFPLVSRPFVKIESPAFQPQIQRQFVAWIQNLEKRDPAN